MDVAKEWQKSSPSNQGEVTSMIGSAVLRIIPKPVSSSSRSCEIGTDVSQLMDRQAKHTSGATYSMMPFHSGLQDVTMNDQNVVLMLYRSFYLSI